MITASVKENVTAGLAALSQAVVPGKGFSLLDIGNEIMRLSQLEVPHDEGTLQNSGTVEPMPDGSVIVGYHTEYAARLHEHPEYRFQKGRKGKYLEDPIRNNEAVLGIKLGQEVQISVATKLSSKPAPS